MIALRSEQKEENIKQRIVEILRQDEIMCRFWSNSPECDIFPFDKSKVLKTLLITVFIWEKTTTKEVIETICKRVIELVRSQAKLITGFKLLHLWIASGNSETQRRVIRLCVMPEALESPVLMSLSKHFGEEYYESEDGLYMYRNCPF